MHRWDVINHFIKKHNYHSYLEIGYFKGWSFDNVQAPFKIAVDPNPSKTDVHTTAPHNTVIIEPPHAIYKLTSDEFFAHVKEDPSFRDHKWDIIFIDGLHEAEQVRKDIENSLEVLSEGGTILLHDMYPPTREHVTTGDMAGNWNGDCYKAALSFGPKFPFNYYTIDSDWGVGVIRPSELPEWGPAFLQYDRAQEDWAYFYKHRSALLNLISVQEFLKREAYATA